MLLLLPVGSVVAALATSNERCIQSYESRYVAGSSGEENRYVMDPLACHRQSETTGNRRVGTQRGVKEEDMDAEQTRFAHCALVSRTAQNRRGHGTDERSRLRGQIARMAIRRSCPAGGACCKSIWPLPRPTLQWTAMHRLSRAVLLFGIFPSMLLALMVNCMCT